MKEVFKSWKRKMLKNRKLSIETAKSYFCNQMERIESFLILQIQFLHYPIQILILQLMLLNMLKRLLIVECHLCAIIAVQWYLVPRNSNFVHFVHKLIVLIANKNHGLFLEIMQTKEIVVQFVLYVIKNFYSEMLCKKVK